MYAPPPSRVHRTGPPLVAPSASVMSPRAPGFRTKIGAFGRRPLITTMRSFSKTGVGAVMFELRPSRHSSRPVNGS